MKNKKGFTLIELLAIIVILAIIAVITVPIILKVIDNSKRGAAMDSAYGYKEAIDKFYASKLSIDHGYNIPDGLHSKQDFDAMGVTYSGKSPASNSFLKTQKNKIIQGCLQFDEYKVEIMNGKVQDAEKGECKSVSLVYIDVDESGTINKGDKVKIENDEFDIIDIPKDGKVKLLAKYSLNSNSRQASTGIKKVNYASDKYWWDFSISRPYRTYPKDSQNKYYIYTHDTQNYLYDYIENYKNYLIELGAYFVVDGRLMTYEEATKIGCTTTNNSCAEFIHSQNDGFWIGSAADNFDTVWLIDSSNKKLSISLYYSGYGIRPVIEISESALTNKYTITFDSDGGTEVDSRVINVGENVGNIPTPTKTDATFDGWYTDKEYTSEKLTSGTIPPGTTTYYARWVMSKVDHFEDLDNSDTVTTGDLIRINNEEFYAIGAPSNGEIKLLAKYSLNEDIKQGTVEKIKTNYSSTFYWWDSNGNCPKDSYPVDSQGKSYIYTRNNDNYVYTYINRYANYLSRLGAGYITDVRLISYGEASSMGCTTSNNSCPEFVSFENDYSWVGSAGSNFDYVGYLAKGRFINYSFYYSKFTIRPLIVINESAIPTN